jgi:hypothetical protein
MESRKSGGPGRPPKPENRTRTRNLVIRMSDEERAMLDVLAERLGQPSASEVFRFLVRREHAKVTTKSAATKGRM